MFLQNHVQVRLAGQVGLLHISLSSATLQELDILNLCFQLVRATCLHLLIKTSHIRSYRSTSTTFKTEMMVTHTVQLEIIHVGGKVRVSYFDGFFYVISTVYR